MVLYLNIDVVRGVVERSGVLSPGNESRHHGRFRWQLGQEHWGRAVEANSPWAPRTPHCSGGAGVLAPKATCRKL